MIKKIKLDTDYSVFLNADYSQHRGSCITYQRREQKVLHASVQGFPDSYHENNTVIRQLWFSKDQLDFDDLGKKLGIDIVTVSSILQPPGNTVTMHRDTFFKINNLYPNNTRLKVRANIYLEDWQPGHFLNYQDENFEWQTSTHWKQGDGFLWDSTQLHLSANAGLVPKYTLQVSGFLSNT